MKKVALVACMMFAGSGAAFAQGLTPMTETQLDSVAAGQLQLGNLVAVNVTNVANNLDVANGNRVVVAIPVQAAVAAGVGVLGAGAAAAQGTQFSRAGIVR